MPVLIQPQYADPALGKIVSNLGTAIYGDPEARMKGAYYNSEVQRNGALTDKAAAEAHRLNTGNAQFDDLPSQYAQLAPLPGETALQTQIRTAPIRGRIAQAYPSSNAQEAAAANTAQISNIYATSPLENDKRTSMTLQGKNVDNNSAFTTGQADVVAGNERTTKYGVAGIDNKGKVAVANINNKGEMDRLYAKPIETSAGAITTLPDSNPNSKTLGRTIAGPVTDSTVKGAVDLRVANRPDSEPATINEIFATTGTTEGKGKSAGANKPIHVSPRNVDDIEKAALSSFGAWDANQKAPVDSWASQTGLEQRKAARDAAERAYATHNGSSAAAIDAYRQVLGVQPGGQWQDHSAIGSIFHGDSRLGQDPASAVPVAAPVAPPMAMPDLSKADASATGPGGKKIFHVGGQWVDGAGRVVK